MAINNSSELIKYIKSDFCRVEKSWKGIAYAIYYVLRNRNSSVAFMFWFRIARHGGFFGHLAKYHYKRLSNLRNIDIPLKTNIGYGLYLGHFMCIVINPLTSIGNNCNISQFLNIGSNNDGAAIIGDNVYIGPHVCIVEDVKIGDNVTIGAGAVVVKDIPANATVAGVPAKTLNFNRPGRYINNRYTL